MVGYNKLKNLAIVDRSLRVEALADRTQAACFALGKLISMDPALDGSAVSIVLSLNVSGTVGSQATLNRQGGLLS